MAGNLGFPSLLSGQPMGGTAQPFASTMNPGNPADYMYNTAGTETPFYPYGEGMDFGVGSPGFTPAPPSYGIGSPGFPAPPVTGPNYRYGTGMGFGLPDINPAPDPRIAQEAERNRLEAERNALEAARGGMNFGLTDLIDNRRQQEEDRRWAEENRRSIEAGYGELARPAAAAVESGILQGGYDPGDRGDAAPPQGHTDTMTAARAAAQREAEYQERVRAEREAIDASIAAARAQANASNPQYNLQTNFNRNVAGLNPTSAYDTWAQLQSPFPQTYW